MNAVMLAAMLWMAVHAHVVVVKDNPGGELIEFVKKRAEIDRRGDLVRIEGLCLSACTLYLSAKRYCVGRNAVLGFHAAYYSEPADVAKEATRFLLSQYPPMVRQWIKSHGGLTPNMILLHGREMESAVRICPARS